MKKCLVSILLVVAMVLSITACASKEKDSNDFINGDGYYELFPTDEEFGTIDKDDYYDENEEYGKLIENKFIKTSDENVSTFSADVDTASYSYFRKLVNNGYSLRELIGTAGNSIRTEEMINYFNYGYEEPKNNELFSVTAQVAPCPWNNRAQLLIMGLKTEKIELAQRNNLVFLIDVSGSMDSPDKLELLKKSFAHLVDKLGKDDVISIVTYSGKEEVILNGCEGSKKEKILKAVNALGASGSTNGEAGLKKAYQIAEKHFIKGGNNRIILASDGDLNVGMTSVSEIEEFVSEKRESGVFISVLGFGTGNYRDSKMEAIADNGNGVYYYIDSEMESEKVFGSDIFSTLYTVAKDVKLQLTFNTDTVSEYRLVGYENRLLNKEDFENDTKDAGELGAGHSVTVCYELILNEDSSESALMSLGVRYKAPDGDKSELEEYSFDKSICTDAPNDNFKFICEVIKTAMIIRESQTETELSLENIKENLDELSLADEYMIEFKELINTLIENE